MTTPEQLPDPRDLELSDLISNYGHACADQESEWEMGGQEDWDRTDAYCTAIEREFARRGLDVKRAW